ncbi:MAG TPA: DUF4384 domain-containing protein, partial [Pyrinomonadaceae bacterium]
MRFKIFSPLLLIALIASTAAFALAQNPDEEVRGAFLTSRASSGGNSVSAGVSVGVGGEASANAGRRTTGNSAGAGSRTTSTGSGRTSGKGTTKGKSSGASKNPASGKSSAGGTKGMVAAPIGIGYTLFMRNLNGEAVSVDPSHEFRTGDRVRIALETNTDGYLYVFYTENGNNPQMIFPDARLNRGENFIGAHVPTEIPSSLETDERLQWFAFDQNPATERLYIVLTREPLPLVPTGEKLVAHCSAAQNRCPWRPVPELWTQVQAKVN